MLVKKIIASSILTSLSCSSVVFAAGMFPNAWKESDEGIWQAYVEGQFVHQSNNLARADSISVPTSHAKLANSLINPRLLDGDHDQDWGFGFGLGYVFASKKYDVRANYFALRSDKNQSASQTFTIASPINPAFTASDTSEKNYYDYSEADITFGNFIHLSKRLTMRLGYGLEFADIKQHSRSSSLITSSSISGMSDVIFDQNFKNEFKGVGPLFTVDGQYDITKYIAVVGAVGASALYGTSRAEYHNTSTGTTTGLPPITAEETFDFEQEEHKIALGLDTRLGLRFSKVVSRDAALNVEAGYEGVAYLNSLQDGNIANVTGNGPAFLSPGVVNYSFEDDYNNYGPYVRVGVDFK